jgi:hypothetical protein
MRWARETVFVSKDPCPGSANARITTAKGNRNFYNVPNSLLKLLNFKTGASG